MSPSNDIELPSDVHRRPDSQAELTVIMVSYNTRELTLRAVETLLDNSPDVAMRLVVLDNASHDGSVEALRDRFPEVECIASSANLGFAKANNLVAETVTSPYLCLLNPDTETYPGAMANLLAFAKAHPEAGIVGGRTVFPDGTLNATSCSGALSAWALFCQTVGLPRLFPRSSLFNSEALGGWDRDTIREVHVIFGCLMLVKTDLWRRLRGFDTRYFMYGEDVDLCLRARALGYRPMFTPQSQIMHLIGASTSVRAEKVCLVMKSRATMIRTHWPRWKRPIGIALLTCWAWARGLRGRLCSDPQKAQHLLTIYRRRHEWLGGFESVGTE